MAITALVLLLVAEVVSRHGLGLGDPPLFDLDPDIEYLYKPARTYHEFGHTISINSHSMRSSEFPTKKLDPRELRVMVIGDSIVTGGAKIDQSELATTLLAPMLEKVLGRKVIVGNIAAGSWGPPNQLAYVRRFGLFDADVVILVLNSGDVNDVPGLEPLGAAWPTSTPWLAVQEPIRKLFERYAPSAAISLGTMRPSHPPPGDAQAMVDRALVDLIAAARAAISHDPQKPAAVGVVLYRSRPEIAATSVAGLDHLNAKLQELGVPTWSSVATGDQPGLVDDPSLFIRGDVVHPSAAGQARLAELLRYITLRMLDQEQSAPSGR